MEQGLPVIPIKVIAIATYSHMSTLAVASPDGKLIATLEKICLQIRTVPQLYIIRDFRVPQELYTRKATPTSSSSSTASSASTATIRWAQWRNSNNDIKNKSGNDIYSPTRLLVANDQHVWVYDLQDEKWSATIDNGSASMGNIVSVDFGASDTEVIVFSDFSSKVTVWSLESGRAVEIKDPKYSSLPSLSSLQSAARIGCGYRPKCTDVRTDLFALLARSAAQDILLLLSPQSYSIIKTALLSTVDAQGVKWSPDGNWLAIWEAASIGYKVYIYTADGNLYRVYSGNTSEEGGGGEGEGEALGVRCIKWSPKGDLAIGDHARRVTLLNSRTFSPVVFLEHTAEIQLSQGEVWEEQIHPSGSRSYAHCPQPVKSPSYNAYHSHSHTHPGLSTTSSSSASLPKTGVSILTFNSTGTLIATRDDHAPTTVWIWNIDNLSPRAVLMHGTSVKSLNWHSSDPNILLIQCHRETTISTINNSKPTAQSQQQQIKSPPRIYIWHDITGPTIFDAPTLTTTTPATNQTDKSDRVEHADPQIQWLRTDPSCPSSSPFSSPSTSSSFSFSFNSSTAHHPPPSTKFDTKTSKKSAAPRLLLTTPHACALVGIPTLDLDTASSDVNAYPSAQVGAASSSGAANINEMNTQRDRPIDNDDKNNNNTLDEVSFASFDFTAGPSAFMTQTGYSAPSDAMTTHT